MTSDNRFHGHQRRIMTMNRWSRWLAGTAAVGVMAAATATVMAGPAAASTPLSGVVLVSQTEPTSDLDRKEVTVECPGTKYVVGTGFIGAGPNVRIEDVIPDQHTVTVRAEEDENRGAGSWSLRAYAMCAVAPPGLEVRTGTSSTTSNPYNTGTASCSTDKVTIGVGFSMPDTNGQLSLTGLRPFSDSVTATAHEDDTGLASNWSVTAYAICAYPLDGLEFGTRNLDHPTLGALGWSTDSEFADCPTSNYAIGSAGYFAPGDGNVQLTSLTVFNNEPLPGQGVQGHVGMSTGRDDDDGSPTFFDMTGISICVRI